MHAWNGINGTDMDGVFLEVSSARSVAVDIVPGFCAVEGEFIRGKTDDAAVFIVEFLSLHWKTALERPDHGRYLKCC